MRKWPFGRWITLSGTLVGLAFFGDLLAHHDLFSAFWRAGGAAFLTMGLLGVGQRFWRGDKVAKADPTGGLGFSPEAGQATGEAVEKVERAVSELNTRVGEQMGEINDRLFALEKLAFNDPEAEEKLEE